MSTGRANWGFWIFATVTGLGVCIGLIEAVETLRGAAIPIWLGALGAGTVVLRGPLGHALARRLTGETSTGTTGEVRAISEQTTAELDDMRQRMAELEERLDFAERLLVRPREDATIPRGER